MVVGLRQLLERRTLSAHADCSPWDIEPQPFPLYASEEQVDCPLQKNYYISVHPSQTLFQVRISVNCFLHLLFFVLFFLRTSFFFVSTCLTAFAGLSQQLVVSMTVEREAEEVNEAFISFLEKVLLILREEAKVIKP